MDVDGDGHIARALGGDDCEDDNSEVHPDAAEIWYDGVDGDCSGGSDYDADGDGHERSDGPSGDGDDCDDTDGLVFPGAVEQCEGEDGDCDGVVPPDEADLDGDGARVCDGDCDDTDAGVSPDAVEACDDANLDEDCDGLADDLDETPAGRKVWYPDDDRDGYGDGGDPLRACDAPQGYVDVAGDCDDADAVRNPDGTWYADVDADGYGDPFAAMSACDPGPGWVVDASDCDDSEGFVHPGAGEGCDALDRDCDGLLGVDDPDLDPAEATWWADTDGDGFGDPGAEAWTCDPVGRVQDDTDCDDGAAAANPAAAEVCDGGDNNCDGRIDDGDANVVDRPTWYADVDGDGWGDDLAARLACVVPGGYVSGAGDCDDADAGVYPDAAETCGGGDEDCDGLTDDADPGVTDPAVWFVDADGDAYGAEAGSVSACVAPAGFAGVDGDCDDADPSVSPVGTEDCATAADDDCDGDINDEDAVGCTDSRLDEDGDTWGTETLRCACVAAAPWTATVGGDCDDTDAAVSPDGNEDCATVADDDCDGDTNDVDATGCTSWYGDADGDGFGAGAAVCRCAAGGAATSASADDCDDADSTSWPGGDPVRLDGVDNNCDGLADPFDLTLSDAVWFPSATYQGVGAGLAAGDVDGDGLDELLMGGVYNQTSGVFDGDDEDHIWLASGDVAGPSVLEDHALATLTGEVEGDDAGWRTAIVGDTDGDGLRDLLIGSPRSDGTYDGGGIVYLVSGAATGAASLSTAIARLHGEEADDAVGDALGGEIDLDGDGADDLLIGAASAGTRGRVYGVFGPVSGERTLSSSDLRITGEGIDDDAGASVAAAGDLDGDGFDDLVLGAPGDGDGAVDAGSVYVLHGPFVSGTATLDTADAHILGESVDDEAGSTVASAGDIDGDGLPDLLVGAEWPNTDGAYAGAVYVVPGVVSGTGSFSTALATMRGTAGSCAGSSLAGGQDLDGDGALDVVVGGFCDNTGGTDAGTVWIVGAGSLSGETELTDAADVLVGEYADDFAGWSLAVGEFDGDGIGDVAVGAPYSWTGSFQGGAVFLVLGGAP